MRLLASLTAAAALLVAVAPATALTRTVHVPVADCRVTVEVSDVLVAVNTRGVRVERWGDTGARTDC